MALESVVASLRARPAAPAPAPDAAGVLARLAGALRDHDTRFLDDYLVVLVSHSDEQIKLISDELMHSVEATLETEALPGGGPGGGACGGVVVASWLAAATAWRAPRLPAAPRALHVMLQRFTPSQEVEVARALHSALAARELLAASDALRGAAAAAEGREAAAAARRGGAAGGGAGRAWALAGARGLAALLLRAALAQMLGVEPDWRAGALALPELSAALTPRWAALDSEAQLAGAALVARVAAGAAAGGAGGGGAGDGAAAGALLAALAHPPPSALRHHPDYLKATVTLSRLQRLLHEP